LHSYVINLTLIALVLLEYICYCSFPCPHRHTYIRNNRIVIRYRAPYVRLRKRNIQSAEHLFPTRTVHRLLENTCVLSSVSFLQILSLCFSRWRRVEAILLILLREPRHPSENINHTRVALSRLAKNNITLFKNILEYAHH
jgi:hypothetical protein